MGESIIDVNHVTFGYRRRKPVLRDINLQVPQSQSLAILGYNGVGKTTLLELMVGLLRPQRGRCRINGALVHSMRDVFQMTEQATLIESMSVRDNIRFRSLLFASGERTRESDCGTYLDMTALSSHPLIMAFELGDYLDSKVSTLSSGLRKRVGIVAGMLFDPQVIMLDEPTNSVDPMTRRLLIDYMVALRADRRTILTVTHDLDYCWRVADRIVVLDRGSIALDAAIADFDGYDSFEQAATLGREREDIDFGLRAVKQSRPMHNESGV